MQRAKNPRTIADQTALIGKPVKGANVLPVSLATSINRLSTSGVISSLVKVPSPFVSSSYNLDLSSTSAIRADPTMRVYPMNAEIRKGFRNVQRLFRKKKAVPTIIGVNSQIMARTWLKRIFHCPTSAITDTGSLARRVPGA